MKEDKAKSYTLRDENGQWLGQVVLTNDGLFASVTDYGNLSYAWRSYGEDFREFICGLNTGYFGSKLYTGIAYIAYGKKIEKACNRFAEKILPPLQKILREEIKHDKIVAELIEARNEHKEINNVDDISMLEDKIKEICKKNFVNRDKILSIVEEILNK